MQDTAAAIVVSVLSSRAQRKTNINPPSNMAGINGALTISNNAPLYDYNKESEYEKFLRER